MAFDYRDVHDKLVEALSLVEKSLDPERVEGIRSLNDAGEWALALEMTCENLYDFEVPISRRAYELLEYADQKLGAKIRVLQLIRAQIVDEAK